MVFAGRPLGSACATGGKSSEFRIRSNSTVILVPGPRPSCWRQSVRASRMSKSVEILRELLAAGADPTYRVGWNYSAVQATQIPDPGPKAQECRDLIIESVRKREAENPRRRRRLIRSGGGSKDDWRASIHRFYRWQEYRQGRWDIVAPDCAPAKLAELVGVDAQPGAAAMSVTSSWVVRKSSRALESSATCSTITRTRTIFGRSARSCHSARRRRRQRRRF